MGIDWSAVSTIAAPIITLFIGVGVNRFFESRPKIISYYGHVSAFHHNSPDGNSIHIHTHEVVLRNVGRRPATNVRLHHNSLPNFMIWPEIAHTVEDVAGGGRDIVIPIMVPSEQITVSYLYVPPLTYSQINAGIKCDQGFAQPIRVLLQKQYPRWVNILVYFLLFVGLLAIIYLLYQLILTIIQHA